MAYERLINWYLTAGYDFSSDSFLEEMKSDEQIKEKITTLVNYADNVSARSKKPFSKGQRTGLVKALDSDVIKGNFVTSLNEREELTKTDAVEYVAMIERIEGLQQISKTDEFVNVYPDIETSDEIKQTKGIREKRKKEITQKMSEARAREYRERYTDVEGSIQSETEDSLRARGVRSPASLIKIHVPNFVLRERGEEYDKYISMAKEVLVKEGITDSTGRYITEKER